MNFLAVLSKLLAESLLSLYPVFVKNIQLPTNIQMWSRFFSYVVISLLFINYKYIINTIFTKDALLLSIITIIHIYTSYRGFQTLESGIAYTLFYLYPLMILLLAGEKIHPIMILAIIGVFLLISNKKENIEKLENKDEINKEMFPYEGYVMIILSALTEALIYFVVRRIKTNNPWNHMFISYFMGALLITILLFNKIKDINLKDKISYSLIINIIIGLFGYLLRFFAISNLSASIYAPLSYVGILMAYVYGIIFNKEKITLIKIIGTLLILIPNIYLYFIY